MHLIVKLKLFTLSYRVIILVFLSPNLHYTIPKETLSLNTRGRKNLSFLTVIEFCGNRLSSFP